MSGMNEDRQRYESLYEEMLLRSMEIHEQNKKRLRNGLITLAVVPVVLIAVRALTESDKVFFLLLWIVFMFAICAYLIGVEYLDDSIRKTLEEVTREEVAFDDLYLRPDQLQERLHEKAQERQELLQEHIEEKQLLLQDKIEARQERFAKRRERRQEFIAELRKRRAAAAANDAGDDAGDAAGNSSANIADDDPADINEVDVYAGNPSGNSIDTGAADVNAVNSKISNASGNSSDTNEVGANVVDSNVGTDTNNAVAAGEVDANYISRHAKREDPESGAES